MKYLLLVLILPLFTVAQDIPKKTNTIKIISTDSADLFDKFTEVLLNNGYLIDKKNDQLKTASTVDKSLDNYACRYIIDYRTFHDTLFITGRMNINITMKILGTDQEFKDFDPITYAGMNGSMYKRAFNKMVTAARLVSADLVFERR